MHSLDEPRAAINRIDRELLRLLAERMEVVRAIGRVKRQNPAAPLRDDAELVVGDGRQLGTRLDPCERFAVELFDATVRTPGLELSADRICCSECLRHIARGTEMMPRFDQLFDVLFARLRSHAHTPLKVGRGAFVGGAPAFGRCSVNHLSRRPTMHGVQRLGIGAL